MSDKTKSREAVMKTIKYDKLVRDKIPEIIEKSGKKCVVEVMDKETTYSILTANLMKSLQNISLTSQ